MHIYYLVKKITIVSKLMCLVFIVSSFLFLHHKIDSLCFTGIPIDKVVLLTQETRNFVGRKLLELTLMELFVFRFMQACSVVISM